MLKQDLNKFKRSALSVVSLISFGVIGWLLFFGKEKALAWLSPLLSKLPHSESQLVKTTENVLGSAVQKIKGDNVKRVVQEGSKIIEESEYTEPIREVRESVKQKINQTIESAKELPAQEIKIFKKQICKEWLEEIATESGEK